MFDLGFIQFAADYIIILVLLTVAAWIALMRGVGVINAATLALPLAFVTYEAGLSSAGLATLFSTGLEASVTGIAAFAVLFVLLYAALYRITANTSGGGHGIIQALISAVCFVAMLLAVWNQFYPFAVAWMFGDQIAVIFSTPYFFWWILGSIIPLFLTIAFPMKDRLTMKVKSAEDRYAGGVQYHPAGK